MRNRGQVTLTWAGLRAAVRPRQSGSCLSSAALEALPTAARCRSQPSAWDDLLPEQAKRLPDELAKIDALDDEGFVTPLARPLRRHTRAGHADRGDV